jgi:hypothetical protein
MRGTSGFFVPADADDVEVRGVGAPRRRADEQPGAVAATASVSDGTIETTGSTRPDGDLPAGVVEAVVRRR